MKMTYSVILNSKQSMHHELVTFYFSENKYKVPIFMFILPLTSLHHPVGVMVMFVLV